mmetsp:Transcript_76393/g.68507  ORF Transcript_76393/g.68507 Transcript_76393/m.68507 type:complete len:90 (+) Transcript_76393:99-368(+)
MSGNKNYYSYSPYKEQNSNDHEEYQQPTESDLQQLNEYNQQWKEAQAQRQREKEQREREQRERERRERERRERELKRQQELAKEEIEIE